MKRVLLVVLAVSFGFYMFGCAKKETSMEETLEPLSMETISTLNTSIQTMPQVQAPEQLSMPAAEPAVNLEPLPPGGPYKPSVKEIQAALKNAGFYTGEVDGRLGPKSKKAVEEFQKANSLQADGKVGPKTWAALSVYLTQAPVDTASVKPAKKKR